VHLAGLHVERESAEDFFFFNAGVEVIDGDHFLELKVEG
jgi:hypothetical protein